MDFGRLYQYYSMIVCLINVTLGVFVIVLSVKIQRRNKGADYSWILAFNTLVDINFSMIVGISAPNSMSTSTHYYALVESSYFQNSPTYVIHTLYRIFSFSLSLLAPCSAVHFWYRSNALCEGVTWSKRRYCLTYMAFATYCVTETGSTLFTSEAQSPASEADIRRVLEPGTRIPRHLGFDVRTTMFIVFASFNVIMRLVHYFMQIYFGRKIVLKMKEAAVRLATEKAQRYVVNVMILQGLYPLIVFVVPLAIHSSFIIAGVNIGYMPYIFSAIPQLMPTMNAITVLTLIPSYRRIFAHTFRFNVEPTSTMVLDSRKSIDIRRNSTYFRNNSIAI